MLGQLPDILTVVVELIMMGIPGLMNSLDGMRVRMIVLSVILPVINKQLVVMI